MKKEKQKEPTAEELQKACDEVNGDCLCCCFRIICPDSEIKAGMDYEE